MVGSWCIIAPAVRRGYLQRLLATKQIFCYLHNIQNVNIWYKASILSNLSHIKFYTMEVFVGPCEGPTMKCVCLVHPPTTHPRHLAQRSKAALPTVPRPQTHTFSESSCQELFKDGNVTQIQRQWQLQIRRRRQRQRRGRQDNTWNTYSVLYFRNPDDSPSPAQHCPEQSSKVFKCVQTCSKLVQTCSNVFKLVQNLFKGVQMCSNLFKTGSNVFKLVQSLFKCVQMCSNLFKTCSNVFKLVQNLFKCVQMGSNLFKTCSNEFKCVQMGSKLVQMCQMCSSLSKTCSNVFKIVQKLSDFPVHGVRHDKQSLI